ncbi:MAG: peptide deformylase [Tepidisphaeraceae bacterium]
MLFINGHFICPVFTLRSGTRTMYEDLRIVCYPDPRLKRVAKPVQSFDANLAALADRMFEIMREHKGVGLAAPQVGVDLRLFVMNPTGEPGNDRVYVNPILTEAEDEEEDDEGCLSIPGLNTSIWRSRKLRMTARDLQGNPIDQTESGFIPRVWQHETDHLNGTLIIDRMGPTAKLTNRRLLKELEQKYEEDKRRK